MRKRDIAKNYRAKILPAQGARPTAYEQVSPEAVEELSKQERLGAPVCVDPVVSALFGMATVVATLVAIIDAVDALV